MPSSRKHKLRHSLSGRACARRRRPTPSSSPRWRARWSSTPTARTRTPAGLTVYTTIRKADQEAAYAALRRGVLDYDRRHGYRGPEAYRQPAGRRGRSSRRHSSARSRTRSDSDDLLAGGGPGGEPDRGRGGAGRRRGGHDHRRRACGSSRARWATRQRPRPRHPTRGRRSGSPATTRSAGRSRSCRRPKRRSSRVRPIDGAILALVGGFDFDRNKFNHVTQAQRQPGSSLQAVHLLGRAGKGLHARRPSSTTRRSSCPPTRPAARTGSPRTTTASSTARCACARRSRKSKNLVTVRVLQAIGPQLRAGLHRALRLRSQAAPAVPDHGAGRRRR